MAAKDHSIPTLTVDVMTDEQWATHEANPRNWSTKRRAFQAFAAAFLTMWANLASSSYISGREYVARSLDVGTELSIVPLPAGTLGFALGPILAAPMSEEIGRIPIYWISFCTSTLFILGSGLTDHIAGIIVCRAFAGFFGSAVLSVGTGGTIPDLFAPHERILPMSLITLLGFAGPPLGFVVGGFAIQYTAEWRYTAWVPLMFSAPALVLLIFMRESRKDQILQQMSQSALDRLRTRVIGIRQIPYLAIYQRPFRKLLTEPLVAAIGIYTAFSFAIIYALLAAVPYIFVTVYGFSLSGYSSTWWAWIVGYLSGAVVILHLQRRMAKQMRKPEIRAQFVPEWSLTPAMIGSPLIPVSLFWLAWTARTSVHWLSPVFAMGVYAMGTLLCYTSGLTYLVQVFGPVHGASAVAGARMLSFYFGAAFPLFSLPMLRTLGIAWALSLLAFIGLTLMPTPLLLKRWGPKLRARATRSS